MRRTTLLAATVALALTALAWASDGTDPVAPPVPAVPTIDDLVETALNAEDLGTLVTLIEAAGLTDTLRVEGPLTLFAPTDAAFAALPEGDLEALTSDPAALREILLAHLVLGEQTSADLAGLARLTTAAGIEVEVRAGGPRGLLVGPGAVVATDILGTNGVIHAVDTVLAPPAPAG